MLLRGIQARGLFRAVERFRRVAKEIDDVGEAVRIELWTEQHGECGRHSVKQPCGETVDGRSWGSVTYIDAIILFIFGTLAAI